MGEIKLRRVDFFNRKAATSLIKEIVKHSPELARLVVEGGGLGVRRIILKLILYRR